MPQPPDFGGVNASILSDLIEAGRLFLSAGLGLGA